EGLPENPAGFVILPPNLTGARGTDDRHLLAWLARQHDSGAILCSVCAGAFWLGHAGLLRGRVATTHWALAGEMQASFPATCVDADAILIDDGDIITAGGVMAWVDLGLHIIRLTAGATIMAQTARHFLVDPGARDQRAYRAFRPARSHGDAAILRVQNWLETHYGEPLSAVALAARANLSARTFLRRFKARTGFTPVAYIQNLRIERARGLLERTSKPVTDIAWSVGYRDVSAFGRVFHHLTGITPGDYRRRFSVR
ncbi:MAG: GlxA family transcriptional regulator, partial [Hyphomicrobiales bacterium]